MIQELEFKVKVTKHVSEVGNSETEHEYVVSIIDDNEEYGVTTSTAHPTIAEAFDAALTDYLFDKATL